MTKTTNEILNIIEIIKHAEETKKKQEVNYELFEITNGYFKSTR